MSNNYSYLTVQFDECCADKIGVTRAGFSRGFLTPALFGRIVRSRSHRESVQELSMKQFAFSDRFDEFHHFLGRRVRYWSLSRHLHSRRGRGRSPEGPLTAKRHFERLGWSITASRWGSRWPNNSVAKKSRWVQRIRLFSSNIHCHNCRSSLEKICCLGPAYSSHSSTRAKTGQG